MSIFLSAVKKDVIWDIHISLLFLHHAVVCGRLESWIMCLSLPVMGFI